MISVSGLRKSYGDLVVLDGVDLEIGVTVFLTTQYLEEADQLTARIALLDRGRVVAEGTPEELKRLADAASLDDVFLTLTR